MKRLKGLKRLVILLLITVALGICFAPAALAQTGDTLRFGGDIRVGPGERDANTVAFGGSVAVEGTSENVVAFGGSVTVTGHSGDIIAFGGDALIDGTVDGNVVVFGGDVILHSNARVSGDVINFGGSIQREEGVIVSGELIHHTTLNHTHISLGPAKDLGHFAWDTAGWFRNLGFALLLGLGWLVGIVFPANIQHMQQFIGGNGLGAFGAGFLVKLVAPIITILLLITVVGIPMVPLLWVVLLLSQFFGLVAVGYLLGKYATEKLSRPDASYRVRLFVGLVIVCLLGLIPMLGWFILFTFKTIGLGAVFLTKFGTGNPWFPRGNKNLN